MEFFGQKWHTYGGVQQYIEELVPLDWNKKVKVGAMGKVRIKLNSPGIRALLRSPEMQAVLKRPCRHREGPLRRWLRILCGSHRAVAVVGNRFPQGL